MVARTVALVSLSALSLAHATQYYLSHPQIIVNANHNEPTSFAAYSHTLHIGSTVNKLLQLSAIPCVSHNQSRDKPFNVTSRSHSKTTPVTEAAPPQSMDLESLTACLKKTRAVGFFTKHSLKNEIDDLLKHIDKHHAGKSTLSYEQLRERFHLLLLKVLALLQDKDKELAEDISIARESIWGAFMNRGKSESSGKKIDEKHA